jgi:hypothetical protein
MASKLINLYSRVSERMKAIFLFILTHSALLTVQVVCIYVIRIHRIHVLVWISQRLLQQTTLQAEIIIFADILATFNVYIF